MGKKFKYNRHFTNDEIKLYPNGWVNRKELYGADKKHFVDDKSDLIKQLIFIKPDIWGSKELKSQYWKDKDYHPTLRDIDTITMKREVLLIGKIIKQKSNEKGIYETVLMSKRNIQINDFTEDQCKKMLQCNLRFKESILVNGGTKYSINNLDVKQD